MGTVMIIFVFALSGVISFVENKILPREESDKRDMEGEETELISKAD